ncbi:hypothetical protein CATRI_08535 [Corynebacterium atrinae]|uniref:hypothetical protein n=1 Tax=Corynebacterium atrinae TaxID=1336740 RepID=UPI0025B4C0DC|nr:hypothetical protein [Corynebacterium atrinae]WJY63779.1 hypothetical protein CATRI_08535 [Corynebacterium atrinae]
MLTSSSVDATTILPSLRRLELPQRRDLSDDGFGDSRATITLSRTLLACLYSGEMALSYRHLGELDLSAHRAWDLAASNLIERASSPHGVRILTRPAPISLGAGAPGVEVSTPGACATAWLAHPHSFSILDSHLEGLLGETVGYLVPSHSLLFALPLSQLSDSRWIEAAASLVRPRESLIASPVRWSQGFPADLTRSPLVPAHA